MENLTEAELEMLEAVTTADDWAKACNSVQVSRGGRYPSDWFLKVLASGLAKRVLARFGGTDEISMVKI